MAKARRLKVSDSTGHLTRVLEAPTDAYVSDVVTTALRELNLPRNSPSGPLEYRVRANGRLVPPTETVEEAFEEDEQIQLLAEPTAG